MPDTYGRHHQLSRTILIVSLALLPYIAKSQKDPHAFVSAGRGIAINTLGNPWKLDGNTNLAAGYRFFPGLFAVGYFDYNVYFFQGSPENFVHSSANSYLSSFLVGVKAATRIPGKVVSLYGICLVGLTRAASTQDTVFTSHNTGFLVYRTFKGETVTYLGALGTDILIYTGLFLFGEVRASTGADANIYNLLVMYRAGIGYAFY